MIQVSSEKVGAFLAATGDINPIHFDSTRVGESVYSEEAAGRTFVPGLLTQSLWANEAGIYKALVVAEPHEFILKSVEATKFLAPVFTDSDVQYKFTLEDAVETSVKARKAVDTKWKVTAYTEMGGRMRPCMMSKVNLVLVSLQDTVV